MRLLAFILLAAACALHAAPSTHVVFVLGDHEYSGERTMPIFAEALEKQWGMRCTVLTASPDQNGETDIPGLEALRTADLAVFFLRWRRLPSEQLKHIDDYVKSGKPVLGLRTTSHSFNYPKGHPLEQWNRWGASTFGTPPGWNQDGHTHFGHEASTDVRIVARHPVTSGVPRSFHVRSWLYRVRPNWPPKDAEILAVGAAVNPNKPAEENPVAWTWKNSHGGRVFFTTLGHPEDFSIEPVQRLFVNAIHWTLGLDSPKWRGPLPVRVPYRGMVQ